MLSVGKYISSAQPCPAAVFSSTKIIFTLFQALGGRIRAELPSISVIIWMRTGNNAPCAIVHLASSMGLGIGDRSGSDRR